MYRISYRFLVPAWSAKPLVSAHDRIMGTHRVGVLPRQVLINDRRGSLHYVAKRQMGALVQQCEQQRVEAVPSCCETDHGVVPAQMVAFLHRALKPATNANPS